MRILSYKISNTDDIIENVQNNDHILIIYKDNIYYYMWFGNINKTKDRLCNTISTDLNIVAHHKKEISKPDSVNAPLYDLFTSMSILKILDETSVKLLKKAKSNISMFKLLKENNLI